MKTATQRLNTLSNAIAPSRVYYQPFKGWFVRWDNQPATTFLGYSEESAYKKLNGLNQKGGARHTGKQKTAMREPRRQLKSKPGSSWSAGKRGGFP